MHRVLALSWILLWAPLYAQQAPTSSKARPAPGKNVQGDVLGEIPDSVIEVEKFKGLIDKVDLENRTITITDRKQKKEIELSFPQPRGREQIDVAKKLAKTLGKKSLKLEELRPGARVSLRYYPVLGQVMELVVETNGSSG